MTPIVSRRPLIVGSDVAGALLGVLAARMFRPEIPAPPAPASESPPGWLQKEKLGELARATQQQLVSCPWALSIAPFSCACCAMASCRMGAKLLLVRSG